MTLNNIFIGYIAYNINNLVIVFFEIRLTQYKSYRSPVLPVWLIYRLDLATRLRYQNPRFCVKFWWFGAQKTCSSTIHIWKCFKKSPWHVGFFGHFRRLPTRIFNLRKIVFEYFFLPQSATQILSLAGHDFLLHLVAATTAISDPTCRLAYRVCLRPFREVCLQRD